MTTDAKPTDDARWERYRPGQWPKLKSAVSTDWAPNQKLLRGYRISDLVRAASFADSIFLTLFGRLPNPGESRMFEAVLVSSNSGTYTSSGSMSARYIVSTSENSRAAIAGGLLAFGFRHGAAADAIAQMLQQGMRRAREQGLTAEQAAAALAAEYRAAGKRLPGLGSAFYTEDPRTVALFELARELGFFGDHCKLIGALAGTASQKGKKGLIVNEEGSAVAILCDMLGEDYDWRASNIWHLIGRMPSVAGAVLEEMQRATPDDRRVPWEYDGPPERDLPEDYRKP
ncbi:MAG: hypothetical protein HYY01_01625 [Chloroflexi bacterium]|nr:hypothetical protein [Chloroflexota bacterium]